MTKKKRINRVRNRRSDEFKLEAMKLADSIGASAAAAELEINSNQIYQWRSKLATKHQRSEREDQLATEVVCCR